MAEISFERIFRRGFGGLLDVAGRDNRTQFWIFSALVLGPLVVIQVAAQMLLMFSSVTLEDLAAAGKNAEAAQPQMMAAMGEGMITSTYVSLGLFAFGAFLLLTAVARRLHDRGRSAWWSLILPFAVVATGIDQIRRAEWMFGHMEKFAEEMHKMGTGPDSIFAMQMRLQQAGAPGANWAAIVAGLAMLWLAIELVRAGTDGANRFGPAPE
ncbi:DUF805 domain-containing protein [Sphingopyxis panaciterrae]